MRDAFKYLTSVLFAAVVVQVALAGYGAFNAVGKADDGKATKHAVEHGFSAHAALGTIIVAAMLLLVLVAAAGRLGSPWLQWSGGLFLLGILELVLAWVGEAVPALGFLHAIDALAIYAVAALLAHRAWTRRPDVAAT
jgi:UDP-N-acetylmuramyl pentapeptide phosphotransferase/UDP-N-acetylglucosamine-1-phosphate transferase